MIDEKKLIEEMWINFNSYYNDASRFSEEETKMADRVLGGVQCMIESQPKVGEWIHCSERLPEEDVDVLLCVNDEYDNAYFTVAYHHIVWQTEVGGMYGEVVAWMPLPEPYKEGKQ